MSAGLGSMPSADDAPRLWRCKRCRWSRCRVTRAGGAFVRVGSGGMVQLVSLLTAKQPHEIQGTPESEWVDFKSISHKGPYDLSTDKGKFELSKDVVRERQRSDRARLQGKKEEEERALSPRSPVGPCRPVPTPRRGPAQRSSRGLCAGGWTCR